MRTVRRYDSPVLASDDLRTVPYSRPRSQIAANRALSVIARGAASAARVRSAATTLVAAGADGATIRDVDGHEYIDFALGLGPVILGHRPPEVMAAVADAMQSGVIYAAVHENEAELAERVVAAVPCAQRVAYACTGTEAVHLAVRVARARTGRRRVIKFDGHYHGWSDPLYANTPWMEPIRSDPSAATHSVAGQPADADVTVTSWNDLSALERALGVGAPAAAVFMEPVPCNFGAVAPDAGYMAGVRRLCDEHGCLLVFDEVLTGFRLALGGAQERLDASPDLTVLSKAIASGFPIAMLVGTEDAMSPIVSGPMRPGGTFNGSPLSVAAAIATVDTLSTRQAEIYAHLDALGATLAAEIRDAARGVGAPLVVNQIGSVMQLFWGVSEPVRGYADAMRDDRGVVARLTARLLERGLHIPERGLLLLCAAHTPQHIDAAAQAFKGALVEMTSGEETDAQR